MKISDNSMLAARHKIYIKLATFVEGDPKAPFSIATTPVYRRKALLLSLDFPHFTLDPYLIMLIVKLGSVKYRFLSLLYDSTYDWTMVSQAIGEHSNSLERAASGIGLHVNVDKTAYMCFNQRGDIFTLNGASLKLIDKFIYLGSSVSSTEYDINTRLAKAGTANDRQSIIQKSDISDEIKRSFFQAALVGWLVGLISY